jgi:hypothetical protein
LHSVSSVLHLFDKFYLATTLDNLWMIANDILELFMSFFRGRNDLYAVRWEKEGSKGYMPAYDVNWTEYRKHKAKGGTFRDFKGKELIPLSKITFLQHLEGKETVGIYPLLIDNQTYFGAIDFDKKIGFPIVCLL